MTRMHVVARGHVQGVGFRWFVREAARAAGLAGWVRNRGDGGVEVEAEGPADMIRELRESIAQGPDGAVVSSLDELETSTDALPQPFAIVR